MQILSSEIGDQPLATPDVPVEAPQEPQFQQGVDGQPQTPENQTPVDQPPAQQWFIEAPTGTRYATPEAAAAGIAEKDRFIAELLARPAQPQAPAAAPADPTAEFNGQVASLAAQIASEYSADPEYSGYTREEIQAQAKIDARNTLRAEARAMEKFQSGQQQAAEQTRAAEVAAFIQQNPILDSPIGHQVAAKYAAMGMGPRSPQEHLMQMKAEGINVGQPANGQPAYNGVNAALGRTQAQGQIFQNSQYGSPPQAQPVVPAHIQSSIDYARSRNPNITQADIDNITKAGQSIDTDRIQRGAF